MVFGTVADALKRAGITLEGDDYTEPALDQLVSAGSTITVHRVDYTDRVETQAIPYDTEYVSTSLYFRNTGRATTTIPAPARALPVWVWATALWLWTRM